MSTRTPAQARAAATAVLGQTIPGGAGWCLRETRQWYRIAARERSAADAWRTAIGRHPGDRRPPIGAPVFWTGGSQGFGHIGIFDGNDRFLGTDLPTTGRYGRDTLQAPTTRWRHVYAGWAEGFNGVRIPGLSAGTTPPPNPLPPTGDDMPTRRRETLTGPAVTLPDNAWHQIQWRPGVWSLPSFSGLYDGSIRCDVRITAGPAGGRIRLGTRIAEHRPPTGNETGWPVAESRPIAHNVQELIFEPNETRSLAVSAAGNGLCQNGHRVRGHVIVSGAASAVMSAADLDLFSW